MTALPLIAALALATLPSPFLPSSPSHVAGLQSITDARVLPRLPLPRLRLPKLPRHGDAGSVDAMDRRLRLLVAQQESWFVQHTRYGNNVLKLSARAASHDKSHDKSHDTSHDTSLDLVQVQVLYASKRGWTAIASHPDAPGKSCVVYVGYRETLPLIPRTRADAKDALDEGRPACDR